jgi:hypothetical protein
MRQTDPSSRFEGPSAARGAGDLRLEEGELLIGVIAAHHVGGPGFHQDPKDLSLDRALGDVSLKLVLGVTRYRCLNSGHRAPVICPLGIVRLSWPHAERAASGSLSYPALAHRLLNGSANSLLPNDSFSGPR